MHSDWVVFVSSNASTDVIVRMGFDGGTRDVFLVASAEDVVFSSKEAPSTATIELLDPATCKVLAAGDLPAQAPTVTFGDSPIPGRLNLNIVAREQAFSGRLPPTDDRCAGH